MFINVEWTNDQTARVGERGMNESPVLMKLAITTIS